MVLLSTQNIYAEPKIRNPFHFKVQCIFYITHKIYGIQVNIEFDLHTSSLVCAIDVVPGGHVKVTINIDLESMKYKGSLVFVSTYMFRLIFKKIIAVLILKYLLIWTWGSCLLALYLPVSSADNLCKQFGSRLGPTKSRARSGSKPFATVMVILKEFFEKISFEKIQQTSKNHEQFPSMQRVNIASSFSRFGRLLTHFRTKSESPVFGGDVHKTDAFDEDTFSVPKSVPDKHVPDKQVAEKQLDKSDPNLPINIVY